MSDAWVMVLALSTALGAFFGSPGQRVPPVVAVVIAVVSLVLQRPAWLCVGSGLLAAGLAAQAWSGLDHPLPTSYDNAVAVLVQDPQAQAFGGIQAELRIGGRHLQASAHGTQADVLKSLSAGDRVEVAGTTRPLHGVATATLRRRHIAGVINVRSLRLVDHGGVVARAGNALRARLAQGSTSLSTDQQALLSGFVLGDQRGESPELATTFRNAGLAHLLAVSGENVAFVLLLVSWVTRRFSILVRCACAALALLFFGALTRWEPSVLRADAMAAVALVGIAYGRRVSLGRALCLAITAVLLADPFLVGSVGFLLSVGACVGLVALGPPLVAAMPGPAWFRHSVGYSVAAQVGVLPVELLVFDGSPIVAVVANLLAEPVAGLVMIWGMVAGLLAGITGAPVATVLHVPTRLFIGWIEGVAKTTAGLNWGPWSPGTALLGGAVVASLVGWRAWRDQSDRRARSVSPAEYGQAP